MYMIFRYCTDTMKSKNIRINIILNLKSCCTGMHEYHQINPMTNHHF